MKSFMVRWKTNGTVTPPQTLIHGEDFNIALKHAFHACSVNAVQTYEEVTPYYINLTVDSLPYTIPITLYYTKHGKGKVYLKYYNAILNNEFINTAMKEVSLETHLEIGCLVGSFLSKVNSKYNSIT